LILANQGACQQSGIKLVQAVGLDHFRHQVREQGASRPNRTASRVVKHFANSNLLARFLPLRTVSRLSQLQFEIR
jgi:hypothetical protein